MRPKMPIMAQLFLIPWIFSVYSFISNCFINKTTELYSSDFFVGLAFSLFTLFLIIEFYYRRKSYTRKVIIWCLVLAILVMPLITSISTISSFLSKANDLNTSKLIYGTLLSFVSGLLVGASLSLKLIIFDILFLIYFIRSKKVKEALSINN